jgi:hypothetical protein
MWVMFVVFLTVGVRQAVKEMPAVPAVKGLGYQIGAGIGSAIVGVTIAAAVLLVLGGVYYVAARKGGVTFREAIFDRPLVIVTGIGAFSDIRQARRLDPATSHPVSWLLRTDKEGEHDSKLSEAIARPNMNGAPHLRARA